MEIMKNQIKKLKNKIKRFRKCQFLGLNQYLIVFSVQRKNQAKKVRK